MLAGQGWAADPWGGLDLAQREADSGKRRAALEALLLENPGFAAGHFNLGTLLLESDPAAAATHLEHATGATEPALAADAWFNLALVRWKQGRLEEAVTDAGKAMELRPDLAEAKALRDELRRIFLIRQDAARLAAEAEARKLGLAEHDLPPAHVGEAYVHPIAAKGGVTVGAIAGARAGAGAGARTGAGSGYRFSLGQKPAASPMPPGAGGPGVMGPGAAAPSAAPPTVATLPPGLSLDPDGRLHGTPSQPGRFDLPLVLGDASGGTVTGAVVLTVLPVPKITTMVLPEGVDGLAYQADLVQDGLDQPQWTADGLPPGLTVQTAADGRSRISGSTTATGAFTVRLRAADRQRQAAADLSLWIDPEVAPLSTVLPPATAWAPYKAPLAVRGRSPRYRFAAIPAAGSATAMALDKSGLIQGTPDQAGVLTVAALITADRPMPPVGRGVVVAIPVNPPPVIDEAEPIALTQGQALSRPLKIQGGTGPFTWQVAEGTLPRGVRLETDGTLRGAANAVGDSEVTIAVHDRWQAASQRKVTLQVKPNEQQPQQDQQQQEQQSQDQQDQRPQDAQSQSSQGKSEKDQQSQQDQGKKPKDGQQDQPQEPSESKDQQPAKDQAQQQEKEQQAQQAHDADQVQKAATDRWLERLPAEDKNALRRQLLLGRPAPSKTDKPW